MDNLSIISTDTKLPSPSLPSFQPGNATEPSSMEWYNNSYLQRVFQFLAVPLVLFLLRIIYQYVRMWYFPYVPNGNQDGGLEAEGDLEAGDQARDSERKWHKIISRAMNFVPFLFRAACQGSFNLNSNNEIDLSDLVTGGSLSARNPSSIDFTLNIPDDISINQPQPSHPPYHHDRHHRHVLRTHQPTNRPTDHLLPPKLPSHHSHHHIELPGQSQFQSISFQFHNLDWI